MGPDKQKAQIIDLAKVNYIASKTHTALLNIEIACLELGIVPVRYLRNIGTIGIDGQLKLLHSKVAVCGAGGLGGTIIELLARQGVGHLVIIDSSRFAETDLNRQIIATETNLGKSKAREAAQRIKKINAAVKVTPINKTINSKTIGAFIKDTDVVVDALDNVVTRRSVAKACSRLNIPFVHGAIAGFSGQLMTVFPEDKGLHAIYDHSGLKIATGLETLLGTPAGTPAVIAAWEVQEVIKLITGIGDPIRNRLIFLDFVNSVVHEMPLDGQ